METGSEMEKSQQSPQLEAKIEGMEELVRTNWQR